MRRIVAYTIYFSMLLVPIQLFARSGGPPDDRAGNPPNRANCTQCHSSFGVNTGQGSLQLANFPEEYATGETYNITVQLSDPAARRWSFELTAIGEENERAGNLEVVNGDQTQISDNNGQPQYLMHTRGGTFQGQQNGAEWDFNWTAPEEDVGEIWFYFAGNAANNDGGTGGDRICQG